MVDVMKPTINGWNTRLRFPPIAPQLGHVDLTRLVGPTGIPRDHLLPFRPDIGHHLRHETGIGKLHLVGTNMQIGQLSEQLTDLIQQLFQDRHPLLALHIMPHCLHEGGTVPRHVNLRDQQYLSLLAIGHQLLRLGHRVILSWHSAHVAAIVELRKPLALQPPRLVLRQVPVEHIHLVVGQRINLPLQLLHGDIASPHILHQSPNAEGGPVSDLPLGQAPYIGLSHRELAQSLECPISTPLSGCLNGYCPIRDLDAISLLLVESSSLNGVSQRDADLVGTSLSDG